MAAITKESVWAVADAMLAVGETPTQAKVREALGGGSFSTIGPLVKEWEAARAEQSQARETSVPKSVQDALAEVVGRLWTVAANEAALGVESARREVEALRQEAAIEAASASDAIQIVEAERDTALLKLDALAMDLTQIQSDLLQARTDLSAQSELRAGAEGRVEAAQALAARADADRLTMVEDLASVRITMGDQLAAADARAHRAEARADKAETKADAVQAELTKVGQEFAAARADLSSERASHGGTKAKLTGDLERAQSDLGRVDAKASALQIELTKAAENVGAARADLVNEQVAHTATKGKMATLRTHVEGLQSKIDKAPAQAAQTA